MSVDHYENFPVGSILLPRRMRRAVHAIYHFARHADDLADEGDAPAAERLAALDALAQDLERIAAGQAPVLPLMQRLQSEAIVPHALPVAPFAALLSAFRQDVTVTRYASFGEVADYCRRSANPVGRLMLALWGEDDARALAMSDGICTALQLINFLQDIAADHARGRVYLPQDELARFGVTDAQIAAGDTGGRWTPMMLAQIERARKMLQAGAPLALRLPGRFGLELRLVVAGGDRILRHLHASGGDVFRHRPVLGWRDWCIMLWRALSRR